MDGENGGRAGIYKVEQESSGLLKLDCYQAPNHSNMQ
jgi:hypothetical protein